MSTSALASPVSAPPPGGCAPREYLVFTLGVEVYAVDILKVREIRAFEGATRVAGAPPFIRGVINLRGSIVPVADLRVWFGLEDATCGPFTVLIVFQLGRRLVGAVVDGVSDVLALGPEDVRPAPESTALLGSAHIRGLAAMDEEMLVVLDIESLMLAPEMALVDAAAGEGQGGEERREGR